MRFLPPPLPSSSQHDKTFPIFYFFISIRVIGFEWIMMIERCLLDWVRVIDGDFPFLFTFIAQGSDFNENNELVVNVSGSFHKNLPTLGIHFRVLQFFSCSMEQKKIGEKKSWLRGFIAIGESLKEKGKQKNLSKRAQNEFFISSNYQGPVHLIKQC